MDVYSLDDLNDNAACLTAIEAAARAQGLPLSAMVSENAPSQFEINLTHRADPVRAADEAMLLKRLIKGVANSQGKLATFMAKPFADLPGNGTHVHVSVCDIAGADANPYLVMAAVLAGIHHGLTARATPDPAIVGNAYHQNPSEPPTPDEAFAAFAVARHLDRYIGGDFRAVHLACLRAEHDRFEGHITPFERDQYLASS